MSKSIQKKVQDLDNRIKIVSDQISDLNQIHIQLQMIKRDVQMKTLEQQLTDSFNSLSDKLKQSFTEKKS